MRGEFDVLRGLRDAGIHSACRLLVNASILESLMPENPLRVVNEATRYVRVTGQARGGFVEFQFSIGDPTLYLEMILPPAAFAEFCAVNQAIHLNAEQGAMVDDDRVKWREGDRQL